MIDSNASGYWIPTSRAGTGVEYNVNTAAAYFPYSAGWLAGWAVNAAASNGGPNDTLRTIHTEQRPHHWDGGYESCSGPRPAVNCACVFRASIPQRTVSSSPSAHKDEDNYSMTAPNADGSWQITTHDNGTSSTTPASNNEQDYTAFVYVPSGMPNVAAGRIMGDGSVQLASGNFTVTKSGTGKYSLSIPGQSPLTGVLLLSPEGGTSTNCDNFTTYEANGNSFDITSWDIVSATANPVPEDVGATTRMASFMFVPFMNTPTVRITSAQSTANVVNKSDLGATLSAQRRWHGRLRPSNVGHHSGVPAGQLAVDSFTYTTTTLTGGTSKASVRVTVGSGNIGSVADLDNGTLTINARSGAANNLSVSNDGIKYTLTDTADTITLTPAAVTAGFTGSGTNTVTGPTSAQFPHSQSIPTTATTQSL